MPPPSSRTVVLLCSRETLPGVGARVRAAGWRLVRIEAIRSTPVPEAVARARRLARMPPDAIVVTSRHAVGPALRALVRRVAGRTGPELWAAGPGTAGRLRAAGFRRVREGVGLGAGGVARAFGGRSRRVVHLRSDLAGSSLAWALRARGHRVTEVVAYRVRLLSTDVRRRARAIRSAEALAFTSPSTVASLRAALGPASTRALGRDRPAVVLGARTARAARGAGFRRVAVASTADPQRFALLLVRTALHAAR